MIKCLIRVWNIKYNSIHCAANLLAGIVQYYVSNIHNNLFITCCLYGSLLLNLTSFLRKNKLSRLLGKNSEAGLD